MDENADGLIEIVRAKMLEMDAAGTLDLRELKQALHAQTGHSYTQHTLSNFRSGNQASFRLALGIAMTGLIDGVKPPSVPGYLYQRMGWQRPRPAGRPRHR